MMGKIYSKPANKKYTDNYEAVFYKEKEVGEKKTETECANLENLKSILPEKELQTNAEVMLILKNLSKEHITPSNKIDYRTKKPQSGKLTSNLWNMFISAVGRWYRNGR